MTAYIVVTVNITDPEAYSGYTKLTPGIVTKYGGKFIIRGGATEVLEGPPFNGRLVLLEFPSMEAARTFYNSPEYTEARAIRQSASVASFILTQGVE